LIGLPEAYWAAIATLVVMQSTLGATLTLSIERIMASALGASLGAVESTYFGSNLIVFALAIFFLGILSFVLRLEKTGYRSLTRNAYTNSSTDRRPSKVRGNGYS
jgi:uncharacterized membrane protein YgaE (UPF0421/DUF939 family)